MISQIMQNAIDERSVQKVQPSIFKKQIAEHLKKLQGEDRRLRFGYMVKDEGIDSYVERMSSKDIIFAVFDLDMQIVAMAHFSLLEDGTAELGLSVNSDRRGEQLGSKLFYRAILTAKILGIEEVFVQCLIENKIMQHLAKKHDMQVQTHYGTGEAEGRIDLEPATLRDVIEHAMIQQITMYDLAYKTNMSTMRKTTEILRSA
jgi:RimJ/RimL family protein N-acetyltransferase